MRPGARTSRPRSGRGSPAPRGRTRPAPAARRSPGRRPADLPRWRWGCRRTTAPGAPARATARRPASRRASSSSSSCRNRRLSSGGWTLRWVQALPAPGRRPNGPSSPCGSAARAASRSSISWSGDAALEAQRGDAVAVEPPGEVAEEGVAGVGGHAGHDELVPRDPDGQRVAGGEERLEPVDEPLGGFLRWGWPRGYIARLCSTMENSTRKSAKSLDRVATDRAPGVWERDGSPSCGELMDGGR